MVGGDITSSTDAAIGIGLLFNWLCSVGSAVALFRLSQKVLRSDRQAALATILFCFNPASVFHSAVYTEAVFALLSLTALNLLSTHPFTAATIFGVSTAARSNGIISATFVVNNAIRRHFSAAPSAAAGTNVWNAVQTCAEVALVVAPLVTFQIFGFRQFCQMLSDMGQPGTSWQESQGSSPAWCAARVPYLYGHVQRHYWGVGFLRYFELKQLPNFLLAAPILMMTTHGCFRFVSDHGTLAALRAVFMPGTQIVGNKAVHRSGLPLDAAIYMAHWAFLAFYATFFMHVQVSTRLLSSCPPLYWWAASLCSAGHGRLVWTFFLTYAALGTVLFPLFYPWT